LMDYVLHVYEITQVLDKKGSSDNRVHGGV